MNKMKSIHKKFSYSFMGAICILFLLSNSSSIVSANSKAKLSSAYSSASVVLIENGVEKISENYFYKDNILYKFTKNGQRKIILKQKLTKFYSINGSFVALDNKDRLWVKGNFRKYFHYKKSQKSRNDLRVVERNVSKLWVNAYGFAFVRKGRLYVYGQPEFIRDYINYEKTDFGSILYDVETPPYLVEYKGVKVSNVSDVFFTQTHVVITTKFGDAYSVLPEQIKDGEYFYYDIRTVTSNDLLSIKNIKAYAHNYIVQKNGNALFWDSKVKNSGYWDSFKNGRERKLKKINKIFTTDATSFVLKKNGNLYGWGENKSRMICNSSKKYYSFKKKVLIAKNISDVSSVKKGVFCLTKDGKLYFRGKNSGKIELKYNMEP